MTYAAVNIALDAVAISRETVNQSLIYQKIRDDFEENSPLMQSNDPHGTRASGHGKCKYQIRSILLYSSMLVFAALVGHVLTIAYHWNDLEHKLPYRSMTKHDKKKEYKQTKKEIQSFADMERKDKLENPSLQSELYYKQSEVETGDVPLLRNTVSPPPPRPPPANCEATVILIRHCEKSSLKEHCSNKGFQRAEYLATLFGDTLKEKWPAPSYLFALNPGERHDKYVQNWREIETILPLSEKFHIKINDSFGLKDTNGLSDQIYGLLKSGKLCDKVALVSWKHEDLPRLAHSLGCGPDQGCPNTFEDIDFDSTWQISYSYHKEKYAPYAVEDPKTKKKWGLHPKWWVSSTIRPEDFDPLAYSKRNGNY